MTAPPTNPEATMKFPANLYGSLPVGTVTERGVIAGYTITSYRMEDGEFVPFRDVHERLAPASPLVTFGGQA